MDDVEVCTLQGEQRNVTKETPGILVLWSGAWTGPSLSVFHWAREAYPGSLESIRIDTNPARSVEADEAFSARASSDLLGQMRKGGSVRVRYYDWPYEHSHDGVLDLTGFAAILDAVTNLMRQ